MSVPDYSFNPDLASASTPPAHWYLTPEQLQLEQLKIFARTWQLVAREDQVAAPGDYCTATIGAEPILLVRGRDERLRAFSNVCRHRAGPVASGTGQCKVLRCGYHGWTYGLDGRLLGTPEFEEVECFRKEDHSLPEFRVETWAGLVFVNLAAEAPPLTELLEDIPARLASFPLAQMRFAARKDWYLDCNWKVYVDNYLEGYHVPVVHPGLNRELDYANYRVETRRFYSLQHAPIKPVSNARLRRTAQAAENQAQYYWLFPNLMLNVYPDNFSTNLIIPLGPERTLTIFEWFFREPEQAAVQAQVARTIEFSDEIQIEDIAICEAVQRGLRSRTYETGRYSVKRENGVHHFHGLLADYLSRA